MKPSDPKVVKARYMRHGQPQGKEYTFFCEIDAIPGDLVDVPGGAEGVKVATITEINVPYSEIEPFLAYAKTIRLKHVSKEDPDATF
jgi:hypothetical protein